MKPVIILSKTQMAENLGFVARGMANFGFEELRLVRPGMMEENEWKGKENNENFNLAEFLARAEGVAKGGAEIVRAVKVFETLEEACHDITHLYATTARRRFMVKEVITPATLTDEILQMQEGKAAILFGQESNGLCNEDVAKAYKCVEIETSPTCPSMNLGMSVSIICHGIFATQKDFKVEERGLSRLASVGEVDALMKILQANLRQAGYFKIPEKEAPMMINLKNIFTRARLTKAEAQTLIGVVNLVKP